MRRHILWLWTVLACVLFAMDSHATLDIDAAFDSGSIGAYTIDDLNSTINLSMRTETLVNTS
jgi:hypothetical protein